MYSFQLNYLTVKGELICELNIKNETISSERNLNFIPAPFLCSLVV